jgi:hypothetical protein
LKWEISEKGLEQWWQAGRAYKSQIETFWKNEAELGREIRDFSSFLEGMTLWEAIEEEN